MGRVEKRLEAIRNSPLGDWTIADVEAVCRAFGIACHPPTRGSHYDLSHPSQTDILTVPFKRPIRPIYIRRFVAFVDRVRNLSDVRS